MKKLRFAELPLSSETLKAVADMGFEEATPIQSLSIPFILKGRDVIGQAQTGTGKTAAFGIPILETLDIKNRQPQALVLCPTRELAIQVAEEMNCLAKYRKGASILPVYGGQPIGRQIHALNRGAHVVIGTPGRVIDHLERRTLLLDGVRMVVLDEADEMLDMGFRDDIEIILKSVPPQRQTVFFSATMPKAFLDLTKKYQKNPHEVKVTHGRQMAVPEIEQTYFEAREADKLDILARVIDLYDLQRSLVFCNTKRKVDEVIGHLQARGYSADGIHGDMNQSQRDRVMARFRSGGVETLVATDVAARGIDVENVQAVFNYDIPQDEESYVHRIGRTGRAGKPGRAFSFASGREIYKLRDIQRYAKVDIRRAPVPSLKDVEQVRLTQFFEKVRKVLQQEDVTKYANLVEHLMGGDHTSLEVAGALLKIAAQQERQAAPARPKPAAPRQPGDNRPPAQGMVRLFINVGKNHKVAPGDILGAIAGETHVEGALIGDIDVGDSFTFVEVPAEHAARIISVMGKRQIRGRPIKIGPAKRK